MVTDPGGHMVVELTARLPYGTTSNAAEYSGLLLGLNVGLPGAL